VITVGISFLVILFVQKIWITTADMNNFANFLRNSILRIERDWLVKNLNRFLLNLKILMRGNASVVLKNDHGGRMKMTLLVFALLFVGSLAGCSGKHVCKDRITNNTAVYFFGMCSGA